MPFVLQLYMGVVIFVEENNNNDINTNLDHDKNDKITSMQIKNNDKVVFFGDIDTFLKLEKKQIGSILTKPLSELFEKEHEINGKISTLNVTYKKSQNNNDKVYKKTNAKNNSKVNIVDIFLPVVLDENIEQSIEECEKYNKMMWKKYLNTITDQDKCSQIYAKYQDQFEDYNTNVLKNSDKLKFTNVRGKTAAVIFFYILTVSAVVYLGLYIFAPGLLISCAATFGISAVLATKITSIVLIFALIIGSICFALAMRISAELKKCKKHNQKANEAANLLEVQKYKYTVENFKYQCEFYSALIDKFIAERCLKPPEKKRAASIFFYVLMGLAIVFWGFCIFAPGLLISLATILGISTILAQKIIVASCALALVIAFIFYKLARYISWKQNDYEENKNPELYSKYNEELKPYKIGCVNLSGEQCKIGEYEYNYDEKEAQDCPLFKYYHQQVQKEDKNKQKCLVWELKSNTKTPFELLLKLKKAYKIPEQFKNTESKAFGVESEEDDNLLL